MVAPIVTAGALTPTRIVATATSNGVDGMTLRWGDTLWVPVGTPSKTHASSLPDAMRVRVATENSRAAARVEADRAPLRTGADEARGQTDARDAGTDEPGG